MIGIEEKICRPNAENNNGIVNETVALLFASELNGYFDVREMDPDADKRNFDKSFFSDKRGTDPHKGGPLVVGLWPTSGGGL